jgi:hypothetical protein
MFISVVKPHYRLDTKGRFYLVTRKGELVIAGAFLSALSALREPRQGGLPDEAQDGHGRIKQHRIFEGVGPEAAIHKLERKPIKHKMSRTLPFLDGARAVGA